MQYRQRLRSRIIISFLLFGTGLSALFGGSVVLLRDYLEANLIGEQLWLELVNYAEDFRRDPTSEGSPFSRIDAWLIRPHRFANTPLAWRALDNGVHDLREEDASGEPRYYKLAVLKEDDLWAFLRYDVTEQYLSQQLMVAVLGLTVIAFSLLAWLTGVWSSTRVMKPVADLARRLESNAATGQYRQLALHFADDEVGQLAAALDDYAGQLTALVERDREFNSDVSHELRTPLAVIQSTTELLLSRPDLDDKTRERLLRIDRAARQSTELTTALLQLSRAERQGPADGEHTEVGRVAAQVCESHRIHLGGKPVSLRLESETSLHVGAPAAVVAVALGNLIGNACKYTPRGEVWVRVLKDRVTVEDTGPGIADDELDQVFNRHYRGRDSGGKGAGLGLAIVRRLCELYGWQVAIAPRAEGGLKAELRFH